MNTAVARVPPAKLWHAMLLIAACMVNVLPLAVQQVGGDIVIHLTSLHCYANQFWQGDWLPRWCMEADGGLGSPRLLFYPPLPYTVTSLLYPLHSIGITVYGVYVAAATIATLLAGFGVFRWLHPIAGANAALAGAMLYLFMPYHSEVMVGRSGFSELWVMAFAPYAFAAVYRMTKKAQHAQWWFALWTALMLLSEPAVAICVLIAIGIYALAQGVGAWRLWVRLCIGSLIALALSAFYAVPAVHYMPFISVADEQSFGLDWANRFVRVAEDFKGGRARIIIGIALSIAFFLLLLLGLWRARPHHAHDAGRREAHIWIAVGAAAIFMMFPLSAPVWRLINLILPVGFPWRMQIVLMMAVSLLAAVYIQWLAQRRWKRLAGDFTACILFLFCFELWDTTTVAPDKEGGFKMLMALHAMAPPEYRTRWTAADRFGGGERPDASSRSQVDIINGDAMVSVQSWSWKGIELEVNALKGNAELRVWQRYFPLWQVSLDGFPVDMKPEIGSGVMLISAPEGRHIIRLSLESHWDTLLGAGAKHETMKERTEKFAEDLAAAY